MLLLYILGNIDRALLLGLLLGFFSNHPEDPDPAGDGTPHVGRSGGQRIEDLERRLAELEARSPDSPAPFRTPLTVGGYGEIHANFGEGSAVDQVDLHRLVFYLGLEFEPWLQLHSETEIEHGFVSADANGEIAVEQLFVDLLLNDRFNLRAGRVLTPLGLVNRKHEPTTFNGVERPLFDTVIIPSTWSSDGIGAFGRLTPEIKYEFYLLAGLDGSRFSPTTGIRPGRIKERPGLHEPALAGRLDIYPFARIASPAQTLRLGLGGYGGGIDNGNQNANPGIDGELLIAVADLELSLDGCDLRASAGYERITGTAQIGPNANGHVAAKEIWGCSVEAAGHVMPSHWKTGRLSRADLVLFARFDLVDTQSKVRSGFAKDLAGTRHELTVGATYFFNRSIVLKADLQLGDDRHRGDRNTLVNLGLGWEF